MNFINIHILWNLLWIMPLLVIVYVWAAGRRDKILSLILGPRAKAPDFITVSYRKRFIRFALLSVALVFIVLAAARPYWGMRLIPYSGKGRDLLFVFDVSKSMLSKDIKPSRLEHAKWFARSLVSNTSGDRYGLIAFAGTAFLECPLTTDKTSFFQILDELDTETIPMGGTNIQRALEMAMKAFGAAETTHRAVVLISDGDELTGRSSDIVSRMKDINIPLFVVGVGNPAKPGLIPVDGKNGKTTFLRDSKGELIKSRLNEKQLSRLAVETGGIYVRSTATNPGISQLLKRVKKLVPEEYEEGKQTRPIERFYFPLIIAIIFLFIRFCLSERTMRGLKNKNAVALIALFFLFATGNIKAQMKTVRKPAKPLPQTSVAGADENGTVNQIKLSDKELENPESIYNKALSIHKESPEKASPLYEQAINSAPGKNDVRAKSYHNLGVIQHYKARNELARSTTMVKQQKLDEALKIIDSTLAEMNKVEALYRESFRSVKNVRKEKAVKNPKDEPGVTPSDTAVNQQKLLNDKKMAEELKKKIEELKKKQKEARQKTQKAHQKQKKANKKRKQQQQRQQQQQQQQQQQRESPREKANKATEEAQKAVKDFKQQAGNLGQKKMEQAASQAEKELREALKAQKENKGGKAEKHLDKALKQLSHEQDRKKQEKKNRKGKQEDDKQNRKGSEKDKQRQDKNEKTPGKSPEAKDRKLPKPRKAQSRKVGEKQKEKDIDKKQAEALLEIMANKEKNLRDAIKEHRKRYKVKGVEKDW